MKMKHLLGQPDQPASDHISANASSTRGLPKDDREMGSDATPIAGDILMKNSAFCWLPRGVDLNPARMVLAEVVGTFVLMYCICGIIASTQLTGGQTGLLEYACTAGLTVVVLIFCIGSISGAHVNPAVTIAFATFGCFPWSRVPFYVLGQTVGAISATFVGKSVYGIKPELMATMPPHGCISAFWVELIATFIIMFVCASLTYQARSIGHLSGFVIGIAIGLAVLITGPVSGGSMNPARSIGPAVVAWNFKDIWVYLTAPVIGAAAGVLTFNGLRLRQRPCSSNSSADATLPFHSIPHNFVAAN